MIRVADPIIGKNASKYLQECLHTGWVSSKGPFVKRFEIEFASYIGVKHAITTTSGTTALHLALAALGIGPGDEVILPTLTMIATILPILYVGATPVLVDSQDATGNLSTTEVEQSITTKTRAIIPVHFHGHPANIIALKKLAISKKIALIEDAAEAHGAEINMKRAGSATGWTKVGSIGDVGCFSFYANKIITTGEGGMVTTNDATLARHMESLRNLARDKHKHFLHKEIGFTYRMSNLQAALGVSQLEEVDSFVKKKRDIAHAYTKDLVAIPHVSLPIELPYVRSVWWQYGILLKSESIRNYLARYLKHKGIETRTFFVPLHKQPALQTHFLRTHKRFPIAESLSRRGLCLPSGLTITSKQINWICMHIKNALKKAKN